MDVTLRCATGDCRIRQGPVAELTTLCAQRRAVVITDANVRRLHPQSFPTSEVLEVGLGESAKTLDTVASLYDQFHAIGLERGGVVIAIGGGIVCDVAAFAAATWLRGVETVLVPTTLLAQADAGVGGKNGVNFRGVKNLVGTIRQPSLVLCDRSFLATLPDAELRNGLAEVVKAAAIADGALFEELEDGAERLLDREPAVLERAVLGALEVKVRIVQADELETGDRRKLNFGHTVGHAFEALLGLRHGEAVSAGMVFAARLSERRGLAAPGTAERLERLLLALGLPTRLGADVDTLIKAIAHDKKRSGDGIRMALLESIGAAVLAQVPLREVQEALLEVVR
jgi:3-dehydroquinate synthase